jgi:hypothetical protein
MMRTTLTALCALGALALIATPAKGAPVAAGQQPGTATQAAVQITVAKHSSAPCNVSIPVIGGLVSTVTNAACGVGSDVASGVGDVAGDVGSSVLDAVAGWLIGAATAITGYVAKEMTATSTPQLESSWYEAQFLPMADLGAGLALLVALIALGSAALRRSPDALAQTFVAMVRAGFGTGLIVALTAIGLSLADQVSSDVIRRSPTAFWTTVARAWGTGSFGGFGSSALAALIAIVEVLGALLVWLELIVRAAAIYIAVLFFPVALAASIWPPLAGWTSRLGRLLLLFVILKPITLIVLALAGNAAAAGLSFSSGLPGSVGTILAAVVIFALAAFAPWALMYLLAADAEGAWTAGALRMGAGQAVAGQSGRSVRTGGGLATLRAPGSGSGGGSQGIPGAGGGSPGGNGGAADGGDPRPGSPALPSGDGGGSSAATSTGAVGGGAVGAAAGLREPASADSGASARRPTGAAGTQPSVRGVATGGSDSGSARRSPAEEGGAAKTSASGLSRPPAGGRSAPSRGTQLEPNAPTRRGPARVNPAMPNPVRKPPPPPRSAR